MGFVIASFFFNKRAPGRGVAENFLSLFLGRVYKKYYVLISVVCL